LAYLVVVRGAGNQLAFEDSQLIYELPLSGSDNAASRISGREYEGLSSPLAHQAPSSMQDQVLHGLFGLRPMFAALPVSYWRGIHQVFGSARRLFLQTKRTLWAISWQRKRDGYIVIIEFPVWVIHSIFSVAKQ
jgi:hypothetical protein